MKTTVLTQSPMYDSYLLVGSHVRKDPVVIRAPQRACNSKLSSGNLMNPASDIGMRRDSRGGAIMHGNTPHGGAIHCVYPYAQLPEPWRPLDDQDFFSRSLACKLLLTSPAGTNRPHSVRPYHGSEFAQLYADGWSELPTASPSPDLGESNEMHSCLHSRSRQATAA